MMVKDIRTGRVPFGSVPPAAVRGWKLTAAPAGRGYAPDARSIRCRCAFVDTGRRGRSPDLRRLARVRSAHTQPECACDRFPRHVIVVLVLQRPHVTDVLRDRRAVLAAGRAAWAGNVH